MPRKPVPSKLRSRQSWCRKGSHSHVSDPRPGSEIPLCNDATTGSPRLQRPRAGHAPEATPQHAAAAASSAAFHRPTALHAFDPATVAAFDPAKFAPVCTASDAIYRGAQQSIAVIVGPKVFEEYAPLIAGGLLRVRLELCVVESFFGEAVLPFVQKNGLSWVLPFHETVETFLAGTIFALSAEFHSGGLDEDPAGRGDVVRLFP